MMRLDEYLRVSEAAAFLGVAPNTIRNWGRTGKLQEYRHPANGYRLFRKADLAKFLKAVKAVGKTRHGS